MNNIKEYEDLIAFHPGSYIEDIIDDLNISQKEYAEKLDITEKTLSKLINGKIKLSNEVAMKLSISTGMSVESWLNLQFRYEAMITEISKKERFVEQKKIIELIDYKYFQDNKYLDMGRTRIEDKIANLCELMNISSLGYLTKMDSMVSYRNPSQIFDEKTIINSNIMIELALIHANRIEAPRYNPKELNMRLKKIPELTLYDPTEYYRILCEELKKCGIILVVLPHLKNAGINGAVKKLKSGSVLLMVNDRGKDADIFWFSLCHELGHIINEDYEINLLGENIDSEKELLADMFAKNLLIDKKAYSDFVFNRNFTESSISSFAIDNNIHPGIVVGRLQNEKYIAYNCMNGLKQKIKISLNNRLLQK